MAEITISNSNSDVIASMASTNFLSRIRVLCTERALNYLDLATTPTPTAAQTAWAQAVLGTNEYNQLEIAIAIAVQGDPNTVGQLDNALDATIRAAMDVIIDRCVDAWYANNTPTP